jgi:YbgC/YbaW family acyl-CoA thioester hydrolase
MKVFETTHLIRFQDCDPFGHLNNSKFIDYFINAREDHILEFHKFDTFKYTKETGNAWVVGEHQIKYLFPAFLMEKVVITSELVEWNSDDILIELTMWNEQKTRLKSVVWTRFVHISLKEMKKTVHGELLNIQFTNFENLKIRDIKFEDRIFQLKNSTN